VVLARGHLATRWLSSLDLQQRPPRRKVDSIWLRRLERNVGSAPMTPKHINQGSGISKFALLLGLLSTVLFILFSFAPADVSLFDAGEELLVGPVLSLAALTTASVAFYRSKVRSTWCYAAVVLGAVIFMLWTGLNILFYLAYVNHPIGIG